MNMLDSAPTSVGLIAVSGRSKSLTSELIKTYIANGKARAAQRVSSCPDAKALCDLFIKTYNECFFRCTRNNPNKVAEPERKKMLEGAIKSAAALCLIAHKIRQAPAHEIAVKALINGKKDFFSHNTQRQLHPDLIHLLDVQMNQTEKLERPELIAAMRTMFEPVTQSPKRSRRQERARGAQRKHQDAKRVLNIVS